MKFLKRDLRYLGILPWTRAKSGLKYASLIGFIDGMIVFQLVGYIRLYLSVDRTAIERYDCLFLIISSIFILCWHSVLFFLRKKYAVLFADLEKLIQQSELTLLIF